MMRCSNCGPFFATLFAVVSMASARGPGGVTGRSSTGGRGRTPRAAVAASAASSCRWAAKANSSTSGGA
eukprot:2433098-Heterocapsa_arctica.AAC.1